MTSSNPGLVFIDSALNAARRHAIPSTADVKLAAERIARKVRRRFEKMDKRPGSSASTPIGSINEPAKLAYMHQNIRNHSLRLTLEWARRLETLKRPDEFASWGRASARFHWLVHPARHRNPDEVTHWLRS